jgi:uncharacterized heparinase superfamily protein
VAGGRKSGGRLRQGVARLAYGNPLYALILGGRVPTALSVVPPDPWPGDTGAGQAMLSGIFRFAGQAVNAGATGEPPWRQPGVTLAWHGQLHGFEWMRDLRAVGGDAARRMARALVLSWLETNGTWNSQSWAPDVLGSRIANWIGLHDFYCASADDEFRAHIFDSLARQTRHLVRVSSGPLDGLPLLAAVKGLIYGGFCLPGADKAAMEGLRLLDRGLAAQILPDGGHIERSPSVQLAALRHLIDMRAVMRAARAEVPEVLQHAIDRMTPALRFFRHGDGGLALFNGSGEEDVTHIDAVLAQADSRGRPLKSAPHTGFERLMAGRTLVLMDTGVPPPPGLDTRAHAGTMALEVSVGKERLIVNCGSHPSQTGPWRLALASTAAHSTVVLADTNSAEVQEAGGLGRRPGHVGCERQESDGAVLVVATHNGYGHNFGFLHRRRVYLAENGEDLRGEDTLEPVLGARPDPQPFIIRFHLHPSVQPSMAPYDGGVLLGLPSGVAWRLRAVGGALDLSESIYLGSGDELRPTAQVTVTGTALVEGTTIKWALRRERKGA